MSHFNNKITPYAFIFFAMLYINTLAAYQSSGFGACGPNGVLHGVLNAFATTKFGIGSNAVDIDMACHFHDLCYDIRCDQTKQKCDEIFLKNMTNICKTSQSDTIKNICLLAAKWYYKLVSSVGDDAFNSARKATCSTLPKLAFNTITKHTTVKLLTLRYNHEPFKIQHVTLHNHITLKKPAKKQDRAIG